MINENRVSSKELFKSCTSSVKKDAKCSGDNDVGGCWKRINSNRQRLLMNNSMLKNFEWHDISVLTEICKSSRYVWSSILRSVNLWINSKLSPEEHEREDDPSFTMPKTKSIRVQLHRSTLKISYLSRILNKTVSHTSNNNKHKILPTVAMIKNNIRGVRI